MRSKIRVAINGYGRIGRCVHRQILATNDVEVIAINSRADATMHAYLLKYDSIYGTLPNEISAEKEQLLIDGKSIQVFQKTPGEDLSWEGLDIDVVIESTGKLTTYTDAEHHLKAGAQKVVVTAPCKDIRIPTFVMGVNHAEFNSADRIISNASCTTNCLAPVAKVLNDNFGIRAAHMTTVHSVTGSQNILDNNGKDPRLARAFLPSIIPTKTGVSLALARVLPEIAKKFSGVSLRVPTLIVSLVDLTAELEKETTVEKINAAFEVAAKKSMQGILGVSRAPLVSTDFRADSRSSIVDAENTRLVGGHFVKVLSWYDNEWGYSARVVDLIRLTAA